MSDALCILSQRLRDRCPSPLQRCVCAEACRGLTAFSSLPWAGGEGQAVNQEKTPFCRSAVRQRIFPCGHRSRTDPGRGADPRGPGRKAPLAGRRQGEVVPVSLLASWCGPCLAGIPGIKRLQTTWGDKGVKIVGVGLDGPRKLVCGFGSRHGRDPRQNHADPKTHGLPGLHGGTRSSTNPRIGQFT